MLHIYAEPIARLLTYGRAERRRRDRSWPDYLELGITEAHVPDLIRMATDADLNASDNESLEVWAPLHAWRALGQLRAAVAAEPLVRLLEQLENDDWLASELPEVLSMIGPVAIPALAAFLGDEEVDEMARLSVPECLAQIALKHPDQRDECIEVLIRQLQSFEPNGPTLNAFLVASLIDLSAIEAIDLIRAAFLENCVDLHVQGDIEDVEIALGLRTNRSTPPPRLNPFAEMFGFGDDWPVRNVPVRRSVKVGRNEPCPCGSGRKFKKCCLDQPAADMGIGLDIRL